MILQLYQETLPALEPRSHQEVVLKRVYWPMGRLLTALEAVTVGGRNRGFAMGEWRWDFLGSLDCFTHDTSHICSILPIVVVIILE